MQRANINKKMEVSWARISCENKACMSTAPRRGVGAVMVGPILNASKLKALLLADGSSTRKCKALDLSHSKIRKVALSLGEVAALDFEGLTDLDLHGNLLVSLDGHSLAFPHLQTLRASNCRINSLENFGSHFRMRQLDLSGNQLTHIMGLADTPLRYTLQALNVASNHIKDFKGLAPLSTFESLESLDIRGNPISDFGIVAEGFALLCCHTLRQLNGRTISDDVRRAVDTWAVADQCGKATAAAVNAFRNALLHPEGPLLLAATSHSPRIGSSNGPRRGTYGSVVSRSTGNAIKSNPPSSLPSIDLNDNSHSRTDSYVPCQSTEESQNAVTRASSSEVDTSAKERPRVQNMDTTNMAQGKQIAETEGSFQGKQASCLDQYFSCPSPDHSLVEFVNSVRDTGGSRLGDGLFMHSRASSALLKQNMGVAHPVGHTSTSSKSCLLCISTSVPHVRYCHGRQQQRNIAEEHTTDRLSPQCRSCSERHCVCCCTDTQTPAGWLRPLDVTSSTRCGSYNSGRDDNAVETEHSSSRLDSCRCSNLAPNCAKGREEREENIAEAAQETTSDDYRPEVADAALAVEYDVRQGSDVRGDESHELM